MDYSRKIVPPSYDVVFKAIFGREESKPLIISLLSSILTLNINELEDLVIMNNELPSNHVDEKGSRLDLRLKLKKKQKLMLKFNLTIMPHFQSVHCTIGQNYIIVICLKVKNSKS